MPMLHFLTITVYYKGRLNTLLRIGQDEDESLQSVNSAFPKLARRIDNGQFPLLRQLLLRAESLYEQGRYYVDLLKNLVWPQLAKKTGSIYV